MNKIMIILKHLLNWIVNIILLAGLAVLLAWALWDVPPQVSWEKSALFFSRSWHFITGTSHTDNAKPDVTPEQLEESAKRTVRFSE